MPTSVARFGIATILWGQRPSDYRRMFDVIRDAGFEGVEMFQHPDDLPPLEELLRLLDPGNGARKLEFLGLISGSLDRRVEYLSGLKGPYLYLDEWSPKAANLMAHGYQLAVHPHYLKKINSAKDAFDLLKMHTGLRYIPDTAHSEVKRENIIDGIRKYRDRLAAIHLKAWRPGFGRASALYARGFGELADGEEALKPILKHLDDTDYAGWILVEQDYTEGTVESSVQACARWLRSQGYLPGARLVLKPSPQVLHLPEDTGSRLTVSNILSLSSQSLASQDLGQLYQRIAEATREALGLTYVAIWSCSELEGILTLQGFAPRPEPEDPALTVAFERFVDAIEATWDQWPTNATSTSPTRLRGLVEGCNRLRLPIRSSWNPHQTRLVLDLYSPTLTEPARQLQIFLSSAIARAFDFHLDRIAFSCAADLNTAATIARDQESFLKQLIAIVHKRLSCENVALFLADASGTRLTLVKDVFTQEEWLEGLHEAEQYYEIGDGQKTTDVWQSREPKFYGRGPKEPPSAKPAKCALKHPRHPGEVRALAMPIVDISGDSIGLIRCVNKETPACNICNFADDDLVILDYLLQLAIPSLRLRKATADEKLRLLLVSHEFKNPVAALIGSLSTLDADLNKEKVLPFLDFRPENLTSAMRWAENLRSLVLRSAYFLGRPNQTFRTVRRETKLMGEIVAPTVAKLRWSLSAKKLNAKKLLYTGFEDIPPVYVDPDMFQMVFFNLIDNAIKYAQRDPLAFEVTILASAEKEHYIIRVRDNGIGIPKEMDGRLFEIGVRGPNAYRHADGTGLGLWLVQHLLKLHGAGIDVTSWSSPTEFTITLPINLAKEEAP